MAFKQNADGKRMEGADEDAVAVEMMIESGTKQDILNKLDDEALLGRLLADVERLDYNMRDL